MTPERFRSITARYTGLHIAIAGDFCLDRYLEIDLARSETSIETGLPVHNVVRVRAQPGGAGTILNNLVALGVGRIVPVSFCGDDGEGYELRRELAKLPGVLLDHFVTSPLRRTFTYCKPLVIEPGREPVELNRLDSKNWTPTPPSLAKRLADGLRAIAGGNRRAHRPGASGPCRDRRGDAGFARRDRRARGRPARTCRSWPTPGGDWPVGRG